MGRATASALWTGKRSAMVLGVCSPSTMRMKDKIRNTNTVASAAARGARKGTRLSTCTSAGDMSWPSGSSATIPKRIEAMVMPTCEPAMAQSGSRNIRAISPALRSPASVRRSIWPRRIVTIANSTVTKNALASTMNRPPRIGQRRFGWVTWVDGSMSLLL